MKRLTFIRHAKAVKADANQADIDRSLNERGEHDAKMMGQRLARRAVRPDWVITSPARRAFSTATIITTEIGFPVSHIVTDAAIYDAELAALVQVVQQLADTYQDVMLFGHNPGFLLLSRFLTSHSIEELPTCAVVRVECPIATWRDVVPGQGQLVFFDYPKKAEA